MTQEEMNRAVRENDCAYDGIFLYAVKSTGIFCHPSCKSRLPRPENLCFFETVALARAAGFRPCKRCRSDLPDYHPLGETARQGRALIDRLYQNEEEMEFQLGQVGVSRHRLTELFKAQYGLTPAKYIQTLRLGEAKRLLADTEERVIVIAYAVGFGSLSAFYRFFKESTGVTPASFRKHCHDRVSYDEKETIL